MPVNTTPRPIDVCSHQIKDLQDQVKIMNCNIISLREQVRVLKDDLNKEKFEVVKKTETEIATEKGWFW
jgi:hypothetical protein